MIPATDVYADLSGLARLRADARADAQSPETLRKAARQFEALFIQMVLKNMRAAKLAEGALDHEGTDQFRDMLDSQLSVSMSQGRGLGLADVIVRQLSRQAGAAATPEAGQPAPPLRMPTSTPDELARSPENFVQALWPHAQATAGDLAVDPRALLAQAALETGWGRGVIRHSDGRNSHNVFGIKATSEWRGERVRVATTEYENGVAVGRSAEFRAYGSYADAFADYARILRQPRYARALRAGADPVAFAHALTGAGYATDPAYGRKMASVINGYTLNATLADVRGRTRVAGAPSGEANTARGAPEATALKISGGGPLT